MLKHNWIILLLTGTGLMLTTGCAAGHMAGGGRLLPCVDINNCIGAAPTTPSVTKLPFSFDLNATDLNNDGVITPGDDRVTGHLNLTFPGGQGGGAPAPTQINRIRAKAFWGGFCSEFDTNNCLQGGLGTLGADPLAGRINKLANAPKLQDFIKVHPKVGIGAFVGFFRFSGKNADTCDALDPDCQLILVIAADLDQVFGPSNGDFVLVLNENEDLLFAGLVADGNLSITSEVVPAP